MSRATDVWSVLYPNGIPPGEFVTALAVAEIANRAEQTGAQLKLPEVISAEDIPSGTKPKGKQWLVPPLPPKQMLKRGVLGVKTVASQAKVTPQTVYAAIKKGALRATKVRGEYRVKWDDAEKWFEGGK